MSLLLSFLQKNNLEQLNYILRINIICKLFQIDELRDINGQTLLHHACNLGNYDTVQLLCSYQAKSDIKDASGRTPMHLAILSSKENKPTINLLIANGADSDEAERFAEANKKLIAQYIKSLANEKELNDDSAKIKNLVFQGS